VGLLGPQIGGAKKNKEKEKRKKKRRGKFNTQFIP
jgi:hypothetical protein